MFGSKLKHFFENTVVFELDSHKFGLALLQILFLVRINSSLYVSCWSRAQSESLNFMLLLMGLGESFCFTVAGMEEMNSRAILTSVIKTTGDNH